MTESLRDILQAEAQRIAECCLSNPGVPAEGVYGFLEATGWRLEVHPSGDYAWEHAATRSVAADVTEALAVSLAIYRERANAWPEFCAACWRR